MNKFLSSFSDNKKIFLGDTDSYTIINNGITEEQLLFRIKVATLVYDVVLFPAAYLWQSDQMNNLFYKIQPLLLTENIMPVIRKCNETRDIKDYYERRLYETQALKKLKVYRIPALSSEIAKKENAKQVEAINGLNQCVHLEDKSVRDEFVELWKEDISQGNALNSIAMTIYQSNIDDKSFTKLLGVLLNDINYNNFSRSALVEFILNLDLPVDLKKNLQERVSFLYLRANAQACNSDFFLSNCKENRLVYRANLGMHMEVLSAFGITEQVIRTMSIEDILRIKSSFEYIAFINKYNELIDSIYYEQQNIIDQTKKKINRQFREETMKRLVYRSAIPALGVSSTIFVGLIVNYLSGSTISNNSFLASGGVMGTSFVLKQLEKVNKNIYSTSFISFKDYIIKDKYKQKLQKCINGVIY